jgi:hypothetical protein
MQVFYQIFLNYFYQACLGAIYLSRPTTLKDTKKISYIQAFPHLFIHNLSTSDF